MDRHVVMRIVSDVDAEIIAFSNVDRGPGEHPIHSDYCLLMAQSAYILDLHLKMMIQCYKMCEILGWSQSCTNIKLVCFHCSFNDP